jgi:phenylacetate-CoA ligase
VTNHRDLRRFGRAAWDAWRATRGGPNAVFARQHTRLAATLRFARQHSAFYANRLDPRSLRAADDLSLIPPVTKPELMAAFEAWVTDPAVRYVDVDRFIHDPANIGRPFHGRYTVFTTSGSTGAPAVLLHDEQELATIAALSLVRGTLAWSSPRGILASAWHLLRGRQRLAAVFATGSHLPAVSIAERRRRGGLGRQLKVFSILTPLPALVDALNAFQPSRMDSYPSALAILAGEQQAGRLAIHPALLTTVGETLTLPVRGQIESAFGARVYQHYSTAETGTLAQECRHQRLHLNSDWFVLEPVDQALNPVPPNRRSHGILVTSLANRIQPLIRYHIGDSVVLHAEPCPCGSPLPVLSVEGPADETLVIKTSAGERRLLPLAVYGRLKQIADVQRYQLIQDAPDGLRLRLEVRPGLGEAASEAVWRSADTAVRELLGLPDISLVRAAEPPQADPYSGKYRFQWAAPEIAAPTQANARPLS